MPNTQIVDNRLNKLIANLADDFSLEKLSKSPARFDLQKLTWFNREYLKMMSLDEFCTRAAQLKLDQRTTDKNLRVGDYVYLVDLKTQKTYVQIMDFDNLGVDGFRYHQLGGGREIGEDSMSGLIRETLEETDGKLQLDPTKIINIAQYEIIYDTPRESSDPDTDGRKRYDGKVHNIYFYELDQNQLLNQINSEGENYQWLDLTQVLARNHYINFPIWKHFCQENNLVCVEPNHQILTQYLAWQLDKNRVSLLTEFGSESQTILDWQKPELAEIAWKKITEEQSLANLKEIQIVIENFYKSVELDIKQEQEILFEIVKKEIYFKTENGIEIALTNLASKWETELKKWLVENGKEAGSYLWPLRVALSGRQKSPSPFELLAILSFEEMQKRLGSF